MIDHTFNFIAGMPRSGSTLLCNILAQNPRFHCTHTSGCMDVMFGVRNQWDKLIEHQAHPDPKIKQRVLRAIMVAYYANITKPVVFDKCRGWLSLLEMAENVLDRKAKVVVPVRSLPEILGSMERLHRKTSEEKQPPFEGEKYFQMQTIDGRVSHWLGGDGVVGLAFNRITDAIQRGFRDRLHFVEFDRLTADPSTTIRELYSFIDEPLYAHDFNHVEQVTTEDDSVHGYVDLHTIRPKIEPVPHVARKILGQTIYNRLTAISLPWSE